MAEKIIDAKGCPCPKPLMMAKKALDEARRGETFSIVLDNETSKQNVEKFLIDNGHTIVSATMDQGVFTLRVTKELAKETVFPLREEYCTPPPQNYSGEHIIVIKNKTMGFGSEELGAILLQGFLNTVSSVSPLPAAIIFYNSGIHLTVAGSLLLPALKGLEEKGVKILVCGTCLDYYKKKQDLLVGQVSNMYDILEMLTNARHIIYP